MLGASAWLFEVDAAADVPHLLSRPGAHAADGSAGSVTAEGGEEEEEATVIGEQPRIQGFGVFSNPEP